MALCGVCSSPNLGKSEVWYSARNFSAKSVGQKLNRIVWKPTYSVRTRPVKVRCSSSGTSKSSVEMDEYNQSNVSVSAEDASAHVMQFTWSDFKVLDRVSLGHGGRADELVFEAIVQDPDSPLFNQGVVLRKLTTTHAQRRGRRAIEVLKKLARRRLLYHSYSLQVHGYISSNSKDGRDLFTLVHGYHGSFSLRHWLQQSDWLPTLEATLALDEESVRKVGDDTIGGPAVSRQLRMIRILMRDLLIGVNYLHSHGLAHTELRLENVHISPVDRHIKVGILGNAADFYEDGPSSSNRYSNMDRRQMMIAFDMRCVGFMMAKMILKELMDPLIFAKFKSFLAKGNDPSSLREFFVKTLNTNSQSGNVGVQILDRYWGSGWHLLSLLIAARPSKRISCLDALKHPFLCGPRWRVAPSMDIIRWGLGSTAVRISEEYIYHKPQRQRLAHFIELMEMLNPYPKPKNWLELFPGKWRLLYSTGRHIGLTLRQATTRALIGNVHLTITRASKVNDVLSFTTEVGFTAMTSKDWPHGKTGTTGKLQTLSQVRLVAGRRLYLKEEKNIGKFSLGGPDTEEPLAQKLESEKWKKVVPFKEFPSSLPVAKLVSGEIEVTMNLDDRVESPGNVVQEVRKQIPPEMFDLSKLVCGTYVDRRLLVLRCVNGSALLFTRSCLDHNLM
ncbi:PREDICTED: probable plastid-lipid-associated protein 14, chloroplastic [Tarenaya hassleriana]|uniref:probable plastid-lipid-associated protein 14, chloroplastic n=1 Tax=Tarenaya hassleriana TaxID=28532 RepID=UPI00053C3515|nr:PREDICTED: probable plastid-lipid-associated protein 14, chloroplastic [Tarenaya hassleriana]XP_010521394.1 PREDICTED: probable plastid-lipid-associated protein 14, chloroplastic [Tarenaya hassleriana]